MNMPMPFLRVFLTALILAGGCTQEPGQKTAETSPAAKLPPERGEALFKQFCSPCHPDGGNVSDPGKTLRGDVLAANHITSPADIVKIMRNPKSRMIRFDTATLPDSDALAIAEYVLRAFK